jgi:hypothetical protein
VWGSYPNPQRTILCPSAHSNDMGRWTYHFDVMADPRTPEAMREPWKMLAQLLPGTRMRYQDWDTETNVGIWVLTDQVRGHHQYEGLRLGVWPD